MVFEHGMTLVGSREDLQERVQMPGAAGIDGVRIQDTLKRLAGKSTGHARARGRACEAKRSLTARVGRIPSCVAIWRKSDKML